MPEIGSQSVDLIVTSPPYPMITMWDGIFTDQDERIGKALVEGRGRDAFEGMHALLDAIWHECDRVLKPGGIVCINIGDATRTIDNDFQLYSNHSRILQSFLHLGYAVLPDILWRKQTNAPNKFMGSGMLPVGAYVTYEHEYILILRKGVRRKFTSPAEQQLRRESAFFWEERNLWFSDVWEDIKGTRQALVEASARERSAAFPFELAYRLICMFSIKSDLVLDPFAGTGTTVAAAMASGRSAVGAEFDSSLIGTALQSLMTLKGFANAYMEDRLFRHAAYVEKRAGEKGPMKYENEHYGFPVMTRQERELLFNDLIEVTQAGVNSFSVIYDDMPQTHLKEKWKDVAWSHGEEGRAHGEKTKDKRQEPPASSREQKQLGF